MKIKQIEIYPITLFHPNYFGIGFGNRSPRTKVLLDTTLMRGVIQLLRSARGSKQKRKNVIVRFITDSGIAGWGEASPMTTVTGETTDTVVNTLRKLAPKLINSPFSNVEETLQIVDPLLLGKPAAKASIDIALHDLLGKALLKPLSTLLGGLKREVVTDLSIGMESPKKMAEAAANAVQQGFKSIKIKVGGNPSEDVKRVKLVREAIGDTTQLRVDANQSWTVKQTIAVVNKIVPFNVQFVEQPVIAEDLQGLATIRKNSPIPIMADESIHSLEDAKHLIQAEAVDIFNIKLMKCGGMLEAIKIATAAEDAKIPCMIGCWGETRIGITAAANLAGSIKNIVYADLDSDILFEEKLVKKGGCTFEGSNRKLPDAAGLGIEEIDKTLLGEPTEIYT